MAELDLIGLMLPAEYGGSEMSALEGAVVYMELGRALAPSPHFVSAVMSAGVLLRAGTDEQKQEWLPRIVARRRDRHHRVARARQRLRPARRADDRATPTATSFVLDGVKWHVPFATGRDRDGRARAHRRRPTPTSTCSSSTPTPPA